MTRPVALLVLVPAVTRAHDGAHLHPHGQGWGVGLAILCGAIAAGVAWARVAGGR